MRRARIQDVARLADVSLSTVSAVINGKNVVAETTRRRVLDAVSRLKYQPSLYASNLARRNPKVLGLIVSNLLNPFFAEVAEAFEKAALARGYRVSLAPTDFSPAHLRGCVQQMLGMRVAGLAVLTSEFDAESFAMLKENTTPSVFLDVGTPGPHTGNIRVDSRRGMMLAVRHLAGLGHRNLLFVKNSREAAEEPVLDEPMLLSHQYRSQGIADAVSEYLAQGVNVQILDMPGFAAQAGWDAIRSVTQSASGSLSFSAVLCLNDLVALGVYRGLNEAKLRIPEDISVIGFDNTYLAEFLNPPLSTIHIPRTELSAAAVDMLIELLEGDDSAHERTLETELVIRQSTAPFLNR